jgi:hypothetical protein
MTFSDGQLEYTIDAEGRKVEVVHPKLKGSLCASRRSKDLCINPLYVVATSVQVVLVTLWVVAVV